MGSALAFLLGLAVGALGVARWLQGRLASETGEGGAPTDEQIAADIRAEWLRLGLLADWVDVTVIDGVTYLRGRADSITAETLVATIERLPGVTEIRDTITRPS